MSCYSAASIRLFNICNKNVLIHGVAVYVALCLTEVSADRYIINTSLKLHSPMVLRFYHFYAINIEV